MGIAVLPTSSYSWSGGLLSGHKLDYRSHGSGHSQVEASD